MRFLVRMPHFPQQSVSPPNRLTCFPQESYLIPQWSYLNKRFLCQVPYSQWISHILSSLLCRSVHLPSLSFFPQQRFICILSRICSHLGFPQRNASYTSKLVTPHQSYLHDLLLSLHPQYVENFLL